MCSLFGGLSVSCTQGLGACIVTSIRGENQVHKKPGCLHIALLTPGCTVQKLVHLLFTGTFIHVSVLCIFLIAPHLPGLRSDYSRHRDIFSQYGACAVQYCYGYVLL